MDWGDGTSPSAGTVTGSGGSGGFNVGGTHTYTDEGSYTISASVSDSDGDHFNITSTAQVTDAALSLVSTTSPSGVTSGTSFSSQLASFSDADPGGTSSDYSGTVAWGDGTTSAGTIGTSGSNFTLSGTHTYAQGGTYTATLTMTDAGGASLQTTDTITCAGISTNVSNLSFIVGNNVAGTTVLATGHDTNTFSSVSGTIHWGDGTSMSATVSNTSGNLTIYPSASTHRYQHEGYYQLTIALSDGTGATATAVSNVNVVAGTLSASNGLPSSTQTSAKYTGTVLTFTDTAMAPVANFAVAINWGDGLSSAGSVSGSGTFTVTGTHVYSANGSYTVTSTLTDLVNGGSTICTGTLTINQNTGYTITGASGLTGTVNTALSSITLATFTHTGSLFSPSASIDWGDGNSSAGTVTGSSSPYSIKGSHTYSALGTYRTIITLMVAGTTTYGTATITIGDGTLSATGTSISATAGVPLNATQVATLSDGNTGTLVSNFTAVADWGDGTPPTAAYVAGNSGSFTITGGHLYTTAGSYTVHINVTGANGATASTTTSVTVSAPASTLTASSVSATEDAGYSGNVGSFTPAAGISGHTFVATIGWGDGAVAYGTMTLSSGTYTISGTHSYAEESTSNNRKRPANRVLD